MSATTQPDLEEFLSALNGFLEKQTAAKNPSYLRFLEIFCRTVGAGVGHLLKSDERGQLDSVISFGLDSSFDEEFNEAHAGGISDCPLDMAFHQKRVVAIVEMDKEPGIPPWFRALMDRYQFKSLVAVPLLGQHNPVGILCGYYRDVCLFDQGTLDRLLVMGRMVGAATEKSQVVEQVHARGKKEKVLDHFLSVLSAKPFNNLQLFTLLSKVVRHAFEPLGAVCGTIKKTQDGHVLTIISGIAIPAAAISHKFLVPSFLEKKLLTGQWPKNFVSAALKDWGSLAPLVDGSAYRVLCQPMIWQAKLQGTIVAWRSQNAPFSKQDELLLNRLAGIASIALKVS